MTTYRAALIAELAKAAEKITFDAATGAYHRQLPGRGIAVISDSGALGVAEKYVDQSAARINSLTSDFVTGKIDLQTWQQRMAQEIKDTSRISAILGRGGRDAMSLSDWGRLGRALRTQYGYLNGFASEIASGNLTPAEILARAEMYARAAREQYFRGLDAAKQAAGYSQEMRVLGAADHCNGCLNYQGYWAPIGSLPPIGQLECVTNCHCMKVYRKVTIDEQGNEVITNA